jgi:hypothetical protein
MVTQLGLKPGEEVRLEIRPAPDALAVRHAAIRHAWRRLGDAVGTGEPAWNGEVWTVPLWVKGHQGVFGQLVFSPEGEVLPDRSTTKEQLLEVLPA